MERRALPRRAFTLVRERGVTLAIALVAMVLGCVVLRTPGILTAHLHLQHQIPHSTELILRDWSATFLSPLFWGFVVLIVMLERVLPARPGEGTFTVGAAQDLVWFVALAGFQLTVLRAYYVLLGGVDQDFLRSIVAFRPLVLGGAVGAAAFVFVARDLLNWLSHYARHNVPTLWRFHEIHHSQRSLNMFTDARVHFVEPIISATVTFVPSIILGLDAKQAATIATVTLFYERFFHANIRTNLGPLRYVLVTPQSHRIHHSIRPDHYDTNFATVFSVWDRLFGTQHDAHDQYPPTGLTNPTVPLEASARPLSLLATYARQLAYPVRATRYSPPSSLRVDPRHTPLTRRSAPLHPSVDAPSRAAHGMLTDAGSRSA